VTAPDRARHLAALTDAVARGLAVTCLGWWRWDDVGVSLARLAERAHREAQLLADEQQAAA
jgi:hypothetical protein